MRILIIAGWYPNKNNPMKGTFVREQALALQKAGLPVAVFYPFDEEINSGEMEERCEDGFMVYRANTWGSGNRYLGRLRSYVLSYQLLKRVTRQFNPNLLHVHVGYPAGIIAYLFTRKYKLPYIITEHMSYLQDYVDKWQHRILLKPVFEHAQKVLPVSEALERQFVSWGWRVKTKVISNIVDTERFHPRPFERLTDPFRILFAGNMEEREGKGVQFLLPAFAQILKSESTLKSTFHLDLVGEGVKRSDYEALAEKLGISAYCTFHGRVNPHDMPKFYQEMDFLVLPSLKETFGCVLIEAMACGKPVLATACGGPQNIVKEKTGLLVPPGSTQALVEGLSNLCASFKDYNPKEIRQYAVENYGPEAVVKRLKEVYEEALQKLEN